jgi:hypothetical protein
MCDTKLDLEVDGTAVSRSDRNSVIDVQLEEAIYEPDAAVLVARVEPGARSGWTSVLDKLVAPLAPVVVEVSLGQTSYRFEGKTTEVSWQIDASGASLLTVKALDRTIEMDVEEKVKSWSGVSDSNIVQTILSSYQFAAQIETTSAAPNPDVHVVVQRSTDWAFIRSLAVKWGYVAYLEADKGRVFGHFHPLDPLAAPQGQLSLGFGPHGRKVDASVSFIAGRRVKAKRMGLLANTVQSGDSGGTEQDQGARSLGSKVTVLLTPSEVEGEIEPQPVSVGLGRRSAFGVRLHTSVSGESTDLLVRARRTLSVGGVGPVLSGTYVVERVRHRVTREHHEQELTLARNALGQTMGDFPVASLASAVA